MKSALPVLVFVLASTFVFLLTRLLLTPAHASLPIASLIALGALVFTLLLSLAITLFINRRWPSLLQRFY